MGKAVVVPVGGAAGMAAREGDHLVGEDLELAERGRVDQGAVRPEDRLGGVERHAERRGPSAQRVGDRAQRRSGSPRRPASRRRRRCSRPRVRRDTGRSASRRSSTWSSAFLTSPRQPAVVGRAGDDDAVRSADPVDERPRGAGALAGLRRVHRQIEVRAGEQQRPGAAPLRGGQRRPEDALGAGAGPHRAADADDERPERDGVARMSAQRDPSPRATCPMSS